MSVIQVLEKYERKHETPGDDKAGWKRLMHGAVSKAAGLFWTGGGSADVTLGPPVSDSPRHFTDAPQFTEFQSPAKESYFSASFDSSNDEEELFLSLDETSNIKITLSNDKNCPVPKHHSTPYKNSSKVKSGEMEKCEVLPDKKPDDTDLTQVVSPPGDTESKQVVSPPDKPKTPAKEKEDIKKGESYCGVAHSPRLTDLCYEMERLSLKKMIVEVEKDITAEVKAEIDEERKKIEEHDRKVREMLAREQEEKEMQEQLIEMNWFQHVRESQLQVEQDFNAKLESILAATNNKAHKKSPMGKSHQGQKEADLVAKKRHLIETISQTQKSYNSKYNDILELLQSASVPLVSEFHEDFDSLKRNNLRLTDVISKSRCGNVTQSDADECTKLLNFLSSLLNKIRARIDEYEQLKKQKEEANAKLMEAMKKNEENTKRSTVEVVDSGVKEDMEKEDISVGLPTECSARRLDRLKYHKYVTKILVKAEESLESFLNDDKYKNFRKDCQRAVNVPVNAISPTSAHHLVDKLQKLTDLLDGKVVPVMSRRFEATIHPMGVKYCQVLLARKIVKAGEDVVSSHPETGHAIASVVQSLTIKYPILTVYLHAFLFRICPYLVPLDLKANEGEADDEYYRRLGFLYENNEREETDKFLKRMSGVAQLYAAILVAHKRRDDFGRHPPLGISDLWVWLANFISMEPLSDISATILLDMLEVSGHFMLTCYGLNFQKLLYLICTDYLDKINKVTAKGRGGPVERLKTFLEDVIKVKRIAQPKGLLPPQFW